MVLLLLQRMLSVATTLLNLIIHDESNIIRHDTKVQIDKSSVPHSFSAFRSPALAPVPIHFKSETSNKLFPDLFGHVLPAHLTINLCFLSFPLPLSRRDNLSHSPGRYSLFSESPHKNPCRPQHSPLPEDQTPSHELLSSRYRIDHQPKPHD